MSVLRVDRKLMAGRQNDPNDPDSGVSQPKTYPSKRAPMVFRMLSLGSVKGTL